MDSKIQRAIEIFQEVKNILKEFNDREEAIEFLVQETKLPKEECSAAYDFIMKTEEQK